MFPPPLLAALSLTRRFSAISSRVSCDPADEGYEIVSVDPSADDEHYVTVSDEPSGEGFVILKVSKPYMLPITFNGLQQTFGRAESTHTNTNELARAIGVSPSGPKTCRQVVGYNLGEGNDSDNAGSDEGLMGQNPRVEIPDCKILPGGKYRGRSHTGTNFESFAAKTMDRHRQDFCEDQVRCQP